MCSEAKIRNEAKKYRIFNTRRGDEYCGWREPRIATGPGALLNVPVVTMPAHNGRRDVVVPLRPARRAEPDVTDSE